MILDPSTIAAITERLAVLDARRPVVSSDDSRQPVHTCYVPADQFTAGTVRQWGDTALATLREHAPTPDALAETLGLPAEHATRIYRGIERKLADEPVEDVRIDFEDGYGAPSDEREDADARAAARALTSPTGTFGLRIKSFDTRALRERGIRTLDVFLGALGELPPGFVITFPKITAVEQIEVFAELLEVLEDRIGLVRGTLRFELQIETVLSIVDQQGRIVPPSYIAAGRGRVTALHFGTYDYTAGCGLGAGQQHLAHGACDFARHIMQVSASGTGVRLSDGSSNVLPVGDTESVRAAWRTHHDLVRRSLDHGFFQGWDMHPGQLVSRYAAVYAYHLESLPANSRRLAAYAKNSVGGILDEPATARALSSSVLRAVDCGAVSLNEVMASTGIDEPGLRALASR